MDAAAVGELDALLLTHDPGADLLELALLLLLELLHRQLVLSVCLLSSLFECISFSEQLLDLGPVLDIALHLSPLLILIPLARFIFFL